MTVRDNATTVDAAVVGQTSGVNMITAEGHASYVQQQRIGAGYFHVLGIPPSIGREFTRDEDRPNAAGVVLLGDGLWRRRFGASPSVIGRRIMLDGQPNTVLGVMPRDFRLPDDFQSSTPAQLSQPPREDLLEKHSRDGRLEMNIMRERQLPETINSHEPGFCTAEPSRNRRAPTTIATIRRDVAIRSSRSSDRVRRFRQDSVRRAFPDSSSTKSNSPVCFAASRSSSA